MLPPLLQLLLGDLRLLGQRWFNCVVCDEIDTEVMVDPVTQLEIWSCTRALLDVKNEERHGISHIADSAERIYEVSPVMQCKAKGCRRIFCMTDKKVLACMPSAIRDRYPVDPDYGMEGDVLVSKQLVLDYQELANSSSTNPACFCAAKRRAEAEVYGELQKAYHRDMAKRFSALHVRAGDGAWEALTPEERALCGEERRQFLALPPFESLLPETSEHVISERFGTRMPSDEQLSNADKKKNANERMIHTIELQRAASGTHIASDFCPALAKLFQLPRSLGIKKKDKGVSVSFWLAQAQGTGEILTALLVPSEAYENIRPGVLSMTARRDSITGLSLVAPIIKFTDDQPTNRNNFFADITSLLAQGTDLRHVMGRVLELANKFSPHFTPFCQRFSQCFLIYKADDVRNQLNNLLNGGMKVGGIIMVGRDHNGKADMHKFKEEGERLSERQVLRMLGCEQCKNGGCDGEYDIRLFNLKLVCPKCSHEIDIIEGISTKCSFYTTRHDNIRRDWLPKQEVKLRCEALLRDMKREGLDREWGVSYKRIGGAPQFVVQQGAIERMETVISKLEYIWVDVEEDIERYRALPGLDSCGCIRYVSLEMTSATESKFNSFESFNTAHGGYEAQALNDRMLRQLSGLNTMSRRKSIAEHDLVFAALHRARAHNRMVGALAAPRPSASLCPSPSASLCPSPSPSDTAQPSPLTLTPTQACWAPLINCLTSGCPRWSSRTTQASASSMTT